MITPIAKAVGKKEAFVFADEFGRGTSVWTVTVENIRNNLTGGRTTRGRDSTD